MIEINKNIKKARTLPSKFYLEARFFNKSKNIFRNSIQPICSIHELENISLYPVEYFPDYLNENLVVTKKDKTFQCISNVCTHRGHLLTECTSNTSILKCRYHGRTFGLDGKLKKAPGFDDALDFPIDRDHLKSASIYDWNGFLFLSLSESEKVFETLTQIDEVLPKFPYKDLCKKPLKSEYEIDCHWALYCDNYLEGFHIPYVHKGLNSDMDWKKYETHILNEIVLQTAISKDSRNIISYDEKNKMYAYYFFIFPNIMLNYYNWGLSINIIEPIAKEKTRVKYMIYNLKNHSVPSNSSSSVDKVELEDQEVVLSVQKGIKSVNYESGRFSPTLEKGVHYFHKLISERIN